MNRYLIALNDCKIIDTLLDSLVNNVNESYINKNNLDIEKIRSLMNLLLKNLTLYTCSVDKFSNKEDINFLIESSSIWNNSRILEEEALTLIGGSVTDISYNQTLSYKDFSKMYGTYHGIIGTVWKVILNLVEYSSDFYAALRIFIVIIALIEHYINNLIHIDTKITSNEKLFFSTYTESIKEAIYTPYSQYFDSKILESIVFDLETMYKKIYSNDIVNPFIVLQKNRKQEKFNISNILDALNYKYINNMSCIKNHFRTESSAFIKTQISISNIDIIKKDTSQKIYSENSDLNEIKINEVKKVTHSAIVKESEKDEVKKEKQQKAEKQTINATEEPEKTLDELLQELNELIGLENIKKDVNEIVNLIKIRNIRKEKKLKVSNMSFHLVFTGNPGTGKTTIARILSQIYAKLGVVSKGHLVEVDRSNLVAGYVGQTAIKTKEQVDNALGGVLFIDEAYSLISDSDSDFADEAISTILKSMEDNRDDLVVIVAGYPDLMEKFIDSNPGLRSRFNKYFEFKDYSLKELIDIFKLYCRKNDFTLSKNAEKKLKEYLDIQLKENSKDFGNARGVRNIFEKALVNQANRLVNLNSSELDINKLQEISEEDLTF